MRPPRFSPAPLDARDDFVRDAVSGDVFHRVQTRVLYVETDRSGVVHHANYLRYFELGRGALMRALGYPYAEVEAEGYVYPIVDLGVRYLKPLHYDDPLWVHTRPSARDRVRITFDYVITHADTGEQICRGYTQHCALNDRGVPVAIDPTTTAMWDAFPR